MNEFLGGLCIGLGSRPEKLFFPAGSFFLFSLHSASFTCVCLHFPSLPCKDTIPAAG